jgi:diphthamide synthase
LRLVSARSSAVRMTPISTKSDVGRNIDEAFMRSLPPDVDPCGENGEFHSFVFSGPVFRQPIKFKVGEKVYRPLEVTHPVDSNSAYVCPASGPRATKGFGFAICCRYVSSPCIQVRRLDNRDICLVCCRTEIARFRMSPLNVDISPWHPVCPRVVMVARMGLVFAPQSFRRLASMEELHSRFRHTTPVPRCIRRRKTALRSLLLAPFLKKT